MATSFVSRIIVFILAMVIAQSGRRKKLSRGKSKKIYSKSEKNVIIDSLVHPLAEQHWSFVLIDGALHALNEQDPAQKPRSRNQPADRPGQEPGM